MKPAFLDTQYLLALVNPDDQWHDRALDAAGTRRPLVTTDAVLVEVADALCQRQHRAVAVQVVEELRADPDVECVGVDRALLDGGFELYRGRPDKDWSLTDCVSFALMTARGIDDALTADRHFEQAGFRALLRD
jgi:predicted nucleic acid-binding protein